MLSFMLFNKKATTIISYRELFIGDPAAAAAVLRRCRVRSVFIKPGAFFLFKIS